MLTSNELSLLLPEIVLSAGLLIVLILGLIQKDAFNLLFAATALVVAADIAAVVWFAPAFSKSVGNSMVTSGIYMPLNFGRLILAFATLGVLPLMSQFILRRNTMEFFIMMLALLAGGQLLVLADHAAMVLLAVELMSISGYVLAGYLFRRDSVASVVTYFVYGSIATAILCFGFAWMYTASGTLQVDALADVVRYGHIPDSRWLIGLVLVIGAVLFKMTAAPQHLWAPDVYAAAPLPVLALFSAIPKIAGAIFLTRLLLPPQHQMTSWIPVMSMVASASLLAGNFPALVQTNIRRIMAYSSIAHAGFLLLALPGPAPLQVVLFYSLVLALGNLLVFTSLARLETTRKLEDIADLDGVGKVDPLAAAGLTIGLLSLTGLPPFAGFTAKLKLFTGLWQAAQSSGDAFVMGAFAFGLLNTVVALFYYMRMPYRMYLVSGENKGPHINTTSNSWLIALLSLVLVWFFIWPPF